MYVTLIIGYWQGCGCPGSEGVTATLNNFPRYILELKPNIKRNQISEFISKFTSLFSDHYGFKDWSVYSSKSQDGIDVYVNLSLVCKNNPCEIANEYVNTLLKKLS